jgi:MinD-like ATPase involved in chromosome partitioning or flagellar assembly
MARLTVALALPAGELGPVERELALAGYDVVPVTTPDEFASLLESRREFALAVLDGESDFDKSIEFYSLLHENGRDIPALMVVSPRALTQLTGAVTRASINDEYFTRPYSADSLRWRVEAMLIRSQTVDDGKGPIIESDQGINTTGGGPKRATIVAVFNPKGGVGKTTISMNLATTLQVRRGQRVLLVDADTVTGHIANSLGLEQVNTVDDAWEDDRHEGVAPRTLAQLATNHPNGLEVVVLTSQPLESGNLDPTLVGDALSFSRRGYDFIIVDMHPSYGLINRAIFERADRILVPITPDVPALRAGVQLSGLAVDLGVRDKLAMVVNRANSGVSVADMERTVGMPALALIRSGGLLFVRAANEGHSVVEQFPREKVTEDFDALADRLLGIEGKQPEPTTPKGRPALRNIFGRTKEAARV